MAISLTYDANLSRVRIDGTALPVGTSYAQVLRSKDNVNFTVVRGGQDAGVTSQELDLPVDDYEFTPNVVNYYRIACYNASDVLLGNVNGSITPNLTTVWLKFIARPFLNKTVTLNDYSAVRRVGRSGAFDVVGRSFPVAVTEVHSSRRLTVKFLTQTLSEAENLDLALSLGDPIFVHVPPDCGLPTMYAVVGDYDFDRTSRRGLRRLFTLELTEVAAPGADVVGKAATYQTLVTNYATYQDVFDTFATYYDVAEQIGSANDVIVGG